MTTSVPKRALREPRLRDLENRFAAVTHDRLRRAFDTLLPRQQDVVAMIPLLFHLNHALLPGYCGADTPCGIADYTPTRPALAATRRVLKSFTHESRVLREFGIRGIYLMGSAGTVAYARDSDLDVWICHTAALNPAAIELLQRKASLIEAFALNQGVEVHFYVFDPERFRRGETLSLSAESSGSSQHYLLLDEFYRSGLLLAGLKPLWWYVPPQEEANYDAFVEGALHQRRIAARDYVDFGGVPAIPSAEFFGAALWQLYKSIDSPYKSVMKLLLMESYAADYPNVRLLSHQYKTALGTAEVGLDELDPYLALYRRLETYLLSNRDNARLKLLRRAFYLKTDEMLSAPADPRQPGWRREILETMVRAWGWSAGEILALDRRADWRIDSAREERRELVKALQKSYAVLSDFARRHGRAQQITDADLNILGRKLYAAFEKKPHKIELITRGICPNPLEPVLSIHQVSDQHTDNWLLYRGRVEDSVTHPEALKRGTSLVEIVAWCYFNRLADARTEWHLFNDGRRLALAELRRLLDALAEAFPSRQPTANEMVALARSPSVTTALFLLNIGTDITLARLAQGAVLTSSHSDAFQFGGSRTCLIGSVDLLFENSWGELYAHRFAGPDALPQALCVYLDRLARGAVTPASVVAFTADYGHLIHQRMTAYLQELTRYFGRSGRTHAIHHVVGVGDSHHEIFRRQDRLEYRVHTNALSLFKSLGEPSATFRQVAFDPNCAEALPLAALYAHNKPQRIQLFAFQRSAKLDIYVLDENGDLYVERQIGQDIRTTLDHFGRFFAGIGAISAQHPSEETVASLPVEWFQITGNATQGWRAQAMTLSAVRSIAYASLRVFADLNLQGQAEFTCYCDDQEFSSRVHGAQLFAAIAGHVLATRSRQEGYPVYLTQLELSEAYAVQRGGFARRTARLLDFKKRIEYHLTKALRQRLEG